MITDNKGHRSGKTIEIEITLRYGVIMIVLTENRGEVLPEPLKEILYENLITYVQVLWVLLLGF